MVPPYSHRISRVRRYSGYSSLTSFFAYRTLTLFRLPSHAILLNNYHTFLLFQTPKVFLLLVWPFPRSLATTSGISFDFFSSSYLDVSVRTVPLAWLCIHHAMTGHDSSRISPFGHLRIEAFLRLPAAFRSLTRPSSAPSAKAFPLCPL